MKVHIVFLVFLVRVVTGQVSVVTGQTEFCDMCSGTGEPMNPYFTIPLINLPENTDPTCREVYDFANEKVAQNDDNCPLIQSQKDFCGCPGAAVAPINACSLCAEGAIPINLAAVTPFGDTCSEFDVYLRYLPPDQCATELVTEMMNDARTVCGCPADCTICSDRTNNFANPDRKIPMYKFLGYDFAITCQELADFHVGDDPDSFHCGSLGIHSRYCGCVSEPENSPVDACSICADGSTPAKPDYFIPEIDMTCGELQTYLSFVPADQCAHLWNADFERFAYMCGCPNPTTPCLVCPDGSLEMSNPDGVIPYLDIRYNRDPTCRELAFLGVVAKPDEPFLNDCSIFEAQANYCGCPGTTKPVTTCNFCPGGELPLNESLFTPFGDTCEELNNYLSYLAPDDCNTERANRIKRRDFQCGCTSATSQCPLCANHGSHNVTFHDRHIPLSPLKDNQDNPTCGEIVSYMAENDSDLTDQSCASLQMYQGYCGCPETAPTNQCSFCPNGGSVATPEKVVSELFTCQDLEDFVSFLSPDQCAAGNSDFELIQAFAFTCGCPNMESLFDESITDDDSVFDDRSSDVCLLVYILADNDIESYLRDNLADLVSSQLIQSPALTTWVYYDHRNTGGWFYDDIYTDLPFVYNQDGSERTGIKPEGSFYFRYDHDLGKLIIEADLGELDSDSPETVYNFANTALADCVSRGSKEFMIDFLSHGAGFVGFGGDENIRRKLIQRNSEIKNALSLSLDVNLGPESKFDVIGFDSCLMQALGVADDYRSVAKYILASEETEPVQGWDYRNAPQSASVSALDIAKYFQSSYLTSLQGAFLHRTPKTLSIVDLEKFESSFLVKWEALSQEWVNLMQANDPQVAIMLARARTIAHSFEGVRGYGKISVDIYDFMDNFKSLCPVEPNTTVGSVLEEAMAAYEDMFIVRGNGPGTPSTLTGMHVVFPSKKDYAENADMWEYVLFEKPMVATLSAPKWLDFLKTFYVSDHILPSVQSYTLTSGGSERVMTEIGFLAMSILCLIW